MRYGYLTASLEEIAESDGRTAAEMEEACASCRSLDPAGVGAARSARVSAAATGEPERQRRSGLADRGQPSEAGAKRGSIKELAKLLGRPAEHIQIAVDVIRHLDPWPGLRYSGPGARQVEPDVYISKDGDDYLIQLNDDDLPQLRLNAQYRKHARPRSGTEQGSPELRQGTVRVRACSS